jgi:hypothetical protein
MRHRMQREGRTGVYSVLKSMEQGPSFRIVKPKFPVEDPNWRIVAAQRSRSTHLYFSIIDEAPGPFSMRIGAFLPLLPQRSCYHRRHARRLRRAVSNGRKRLYFRLRPQRFAGRRHTCDPAQPHPPPHRRQHLRSPAEAFTENQLEASSSLPSNHQSLQRPDRLTQSSLPAQAPET